MGIKQTKKRKFVSSQCKEIDCERILTALARVGDVSLQTDTIPVFFFQSDTESSDNAPKAKLCILELTSAKIYAGSCLRET